MSTPRSRPSLPARRWGLALATCGRTTCRRRAYRDRIEALRDLLEESTARNDWGRAERARVELDALVSELARAVGLGGRSRRAGSLAERARINIQRRLRALIGQVAGFDAELGRHLELSVRTGVFCMYAPTWP